MTQLIHTDFSNPDFTSLVEKLDAYLTVIDGDDHAFYDQYNGIEDIKYAVVAYEGEMAVGCGAIKEFEPGVMEVKRMFVNPEYRGKGIASRILTELENWASEMGNTKCILETGKRQVEAVQFYHKAGYSVTPNYGQYAGVENSLCFQKELSVSP